MFLMFLIPALFGKLLEKRQAEISKRFSDYTEKIKDIFSGFEVIKSYRMMPYIKKQFQVENNNVSRTRFRADCMFALNEGFSETFSTLSVILVIFISAWLVMKESITMGTLLALTQLSGTFMTPVIMIMQNIPKMQSMKPVIQRLNEISRYEESTWTGKQKPEFKDKLELQNVSFSYDEEQKVLKDVTLSFEKGKKYALLGNSGGGKTTLIKLLAGYYSSYEGSILYDRNELRTLHNEDISKVLCMIHQNVYLFNSTIRNNITLFENFSEDSIQCAVEESGISGFLDKMELGLDTEAGENGSHLSGGQKQRIVVVKLFCNICG